MFTGIIECLGEVVGLQAENQNLDITVKSPFTSELRVDQSVAHNGVCLTVVEIDGDVYRVTAIKETLDKSNLGMLKLHDKINLERCTRLGDRLDGHIVQGHVDTTAEIKKISQEGGSWKIQMQYTPHSNMVTIPKGSVTLNGISLTVVDSGADAFSVAIIPYTYEHTNLQFFQAGDKLNVEFDVIGKYVSRLMGL